MEKRTSTVSHSTSTSSLPQYEHDLVEHHKYAFLKKLDDRLFPEHLLYCEGMPRPQYRGVLHLICACLYPFAICHLMFEANGKMYGYMAALAYGGGSFFCCLISAMYHIGRWNPQVEIFLQKLDHCGIAICTAGVNMPVSLLLLPSPIGECCGFLSLSTCIWTCYNIMNNRPGVWRLIVTAASIVPFSPYLFYYQTLFEFLCFISNCVAMGIGAYIFTNRWPNPFPDSFGYHEVFHVFTVIGFVCIYGCNWSVIHRTCNPYAHEQDIRMIVYEAIFGSVDSISA